MRKIYIFILILITVIISGCSKTAEEKYDNGQIKFSGKLKDGKMQDEWIFYYENGNKEAEGNYLDGDGTDIGNSGIPRNGRTGTWKFYDEQEKLSSEQTYEGNNVHLVRYNINGKKIADLFYDTDKMNSIPNKGYEYYDNGNIKADISTINGIKTVKEFLENGNLRSELGYKDSVLISGKIYREDGSYVGRLMQQNELKGLNIYFTDNIDSATAFNIAKAYYKIDVEKDIKADKDSFYDIFIDKNESFRLGIQVKEGLQNDEKIVKYNEGICSNISRNTLKNKKLEIAFCDENFNILRVIIP